MKVYAHFDEITGDLLMNEYEKALIKSGEIEDENFREYIKKYIEKLKNEN